MSSHAESNVFKLYIYAMSQLKIELYEKCESLKIIITSSIIQEGNNTNFCK